MIAKTRIALLAVLLASWLHPAVAQLSTNGSNTIVRFRFYHGTVTLGNVDVELFDTDKPVTVSNFLHYVRSGAYDNLMLHRCVPGFVIQGGASRTPNPLSTALFNAFADTPKFGRITNEFGVGPQLSNTFGTLAMARAVGDPFADDLGTNSAQADWYFNLTNNSSILDTNYGGFTVFGRAIAGTNTLDFFNHPSPTLDVLQVPPYFYELPVSYTNGHYPRFSEIYHVRITELGVTNTIRPTVTVTSPLSNARLTNGLLMMTGTATDDEQITSIWYRHSYFDWDNSIGFVLGDEVNVPASNAWTLPIQLVPGTNYISVQTVDNSGLRSPASITRLVHYSLKHPIGLTNVGSGTIVGATNQQPIEIGKFISLTAVPAPNNKFFGWTGRYIYDPAKLPPVPMHSNLQLTATFVTNPFPPLKATYSGLFYPSQIYTNPVVQSQAHYVSGGISFSVSEGGGISGYLKMAAKTYPFSGTIHPSGVFRKTISRSLLDPLSIELYFDVTNRSDVVTGSIGDPIPAGQYFFLSELTAYRVRPGTTLMPSAFAGRHTFMIPGTNDPAVPFGDSWGTATISAAGTISAIGALADNTPFSFSGPVLTNGLLPFYTVHNSGRSSLFGWVQFNYAGTNDDSHGQLHWFKKPPNPGKPYPNGFAYFPALTGSRYTPATSTNQVMGFSNAVVILSGGYIPISSTNNVLLRTNNTVINRETSTNKLTFSIVKTSGQFSGSVTPVNSITSIPFKGALLKRHDYGAGFFVRTNLTGQVYFGE